MNINIWRLINKLVNLVAQILVIYFGQFFHVHNSIAFWRNFEIVNESRLQIHLHDMVWRNTLSLCLCEVIELQVNVIQLAI